MSRCMLRASSNICADCSTSEPTWASVNRGVLICDECCSIHRSLGRHISQVKSLKKGLWKSTQLAMVHQLVSHGANSIWEHSLLAPSHNKHGRRKPNPRDPLHPLKADFIRAKYQMLAFVNKQKDAELSSAEDLSKQLHSSVRTGNLETSLRLLSLGADPNYFHPERGNCPLHIAAQAGQPSQVELLVVYGADPGAFDANGRTPAEHAMKAGHTDLADRIVQCQYELTDRLAYYLCGRKPDHRNDQHFIIPQMADSSLDLSELAKAAKKKLMALNNRLFEELAMDVYDEVDRRENETIWLSTQSNNSLVSDRQTVPFLPVNPEFSATRNQGRQKLARFNAREFATLIIDILSDAKRRQQGSPVSPPVTSMHKDKGLKMELVEGLRVKALRTNSMLSDDEPLYDSVASDEDYASIGDSHSAKGIKVDDKPDLPPDPVTNSNRSSSPSSMISFTESHGSSDMSDAPITVQEYIEVKRALAESQCQVKQLIQTNQDLKQEITLLQNMVQKLMLENQSLRNEEASLPNGHDVVSEHHLGVTRSTARPVSMFEPRDSTQHRPPIGRKPAHESMQATLQVQPLSESHTVTGDSSDYDIASGDDGSVVTHTSTMGSVSSRMTDSTLVPEGSAGASASVETIEGMPKQEQVVQKTENITKRIQELLLSAQDGKDESYQRCSEKIFAAVRDMTALFPQITPNPMSTNGIDIDYKNQTVSVERVQEALIQLQSGADHLHEECCQGPVEGEGTVDQRLRMQQVIQCAYDIAKAAKLLVMLFN